MGNPWLFEENWLQKLGILLCLGPYSLYCGVRDKKLAVIPFQSLLFRTQTSFLNVRKHRKWYVLTFCIHDFNQRFQCLRQCLNLWETKVLSLVFARRIISKYQWSTPLRTTRFDFVKRKERRCSWTNVEVSNCDAKEPSPAFLIWKRSGSRIVTLPRPF